jgi:hypothetical protein
MKLPTIKNGGQEQQQIIYFDVLCIRQAMDVERNIEARS